MTTQEPTPSNGLQNFHTRRSLRRRMTWHRDLPAELAAALWKSPENVLRAGACLQTKSRTTVARIDLPSGKYLLKFHHWAGAGKTLTKSLAISPNRRSFDDGVRLTAAGVPTPLPLACVDVRRGPFNVCSYLLTEFVEGTSLYQLMRYGQPDEATIDHLAQQIANIWQSLDDLRFCHNDLKPENLMIDHNDRLWVIDLENGRWYDAQKSLRRAQTEDAQRLLHVRSWHSNLQGAERFRRRLATTAAAQSLGKDNPFDSLITGPVTPRSKCGLSVIIPCYQPNSHLLHAVEAARDFADEVVIVDFTSDGEIQKTLMHLAHCRVVPSNLLEPQPLQRAALEANYPWVLQLEATERASSDLAKEIQFLLVSNPSENGFRIERRSLFCGHVIRFGSIQGDAPLRLVHRDRRLPLETAQSNGQEEPSQKIGQTRCTIEHRIETIDQLTTVLGQSASYAAQELYARGRRPSLIRILLHAPLNFLNSYFIKLGCLDGWAGLHLALLSAIFVYVRYARLWQLTHELPHPTVDIDSPVLLKLINPDASPASQEHATAIRRKAA